MYADLNFPGITSGQLTLGMTCFPGLRARFALAQSIRDDLTRVARMTDDGGVRLTIYGRYDLKKVGEAQASWPAAGAGSKCS